MQVRSLGGKDALEEGMATHCSIRAWIIPWTRGDWWARVRYEPCDFTQYRGCNADPPSSVAQNWRRVQSELTAPSWWATLLPRGTRRPGFLPHPRLWHPVSPVHSPAWLGYTSGFQLVGRGEPETSASSPGWESAVWPHGFITARRARECSPPRGRQVPSRNCA